MRHLAYYHSHSCLRICTSLHTNLECLTIGLGFREETLLPGDPVGFLFILIVVISDSLWQERSSHRRESPSPSYSKL